MQLNYTNKIINFFYSNNLIRFITGILLSTSLIYFFYYSIAFRIDIFEFDTRVTLSIIESLVTSGIATIPFVDPGTFSFCNLSNICSNTQDVSYGQNIKGQFSANITSGLVMLFPSKLLHELLVVFGLNSFTVKYLLTIYTLSIGILLSILISLANSQSKFSALNKISVWIIPVTIVCTIFLISGDRIVGEFISSLLISLGIFLLILSFNNKQKSLFYCVVALIIGLSFEAKSTVGIIALTSYIFLCYQSWLVENSLKKIFIYGLIAAIPKIIFFIYVFGVVNFSYEGFLKYFEVYRAIAAHNADAFLKWEVPNLYSGVMFYGVDVLYKKLYISATIILTVIFTLSFIIKKDYKKIILPSFITIAIISSLIYPTIFSTPYPRIFSFFWAILITCLLGLILRSDLLNIRKKHNKNLFKYIYILLTIVIFLISSPLSYVGQNSHSDNWIIKNNKNIISPDREFEKQYPNIIISKNTKFIIDGFNSFFVMPWDYYLGRRLNSEILPMFYSSKTINPDNDFYKDTYILGTCRWGHCSDKKVITINMLFHESENQKLTCMYIMPKEQNNHFLRLYKCIE